MGTMVCGHSKSSTIFKLNVEKMEIAKSFSISNDFLIKITWIWSHILDSNVLWTHRGIEKRKRNEQKKRTNKIYICVCVANKNRINEPWCAFAFSLLQIAHGKNKVDGAHQQPNSDGMRSNTNSGAKPGPEHTQPTTTEKYGALTPESVRECIVVWNSVFVQFVGAMATIGLRGVGRIGWCDNRQPTPIAVRPHDALEYVSFFHSGLVESVNIYLHVSSVFLRCFGFDVCIWVWFRWFAVGRIRLSYKAQCECHRRQPTKPATFLCTLQMLFFAVCIARLTLTPAEQ